MKDVYIVVADNEPLACLLIFSIDGVIFFLDELNLRR
jgi:hypothetical protein